MYLTWLDSNSWLIELAGLRILLDPWLVGPLVFGQQAWLFKSDRPQPRPIPEAIDLILLSQGLEDHAHPPTLAALNRQIPVVASPSGAKVVEALGYTSVVALGHGQSHRVGDRLTIHAVPGAPLGPLVRENGYVLQDHTAGTGLYYEPHGYPAPTLAQFAPIDVAITPVMDLTLPLLGPIIQGHETAVAIARTLQAQVLLPTAAGGDVVFEGVLNRWIQAKGSPADTRARLAQQGLSTQLLEPQPGERFEVPLAKG